MIIVTGPRGIGKTSLLTRIRVGGSDTSSAPSEVDLAVFEAVFQKGEDDKIHSKELHDVIDIGVVKLLGDHYKRFNLLYRLKRFFRAFEGGTPWITIKFSEKVSMEDLFGRLQSASTKLEQLPRPAVLTILVDEMDPLLEAAASLPIFIRSCTEHVNSPLVFLLAGLPPMWTSLRQAHPSIPRTADRIRLKSFQRHEVDQLLQTALVLANRTASVRITLGPGAAEQVFELTGGHPSLVQHLGYHAMEKLLQKLRDEPDSKHSQTAITQDLITNALRAAEFGTRIFQEWVDDLTNAEKQVLWQIASLPRRQNPPDPSRLRPEGLSQDDTVQALTMLRDEWGLLDLNNQILSKAFVIWLKSTPLQLQ